MADEGTITLLLAQVEDGREGAMDRLMEAVYGDLERVAQRHMAQRFGPDLPGVTLEPAALVNESFLRLIRQRTSYQNRRHFFAIATKVMLRVLTDYQRGRRAERRGGDLKRVALPLEGPATNGGAGEQRIEVEGLTRALERLESLDPRKADVVRLRVVWGLEMGQVAEMLGISLATAERDWAFAKAWLAREAAAPLRPAPALVVGEHAQHDLRGDGEEVAAVLVAGALADQTQERLVDQRRRLQRHARKVGAEALRHVARGDFFQVAVHGLHEPVHRHLSAVLDLGQQQRDRPLVGHRPILASSIARHPASRLSLRGRVQLGPSGLPGILPGAFVVAVRRSR